MTIKPITVDITWRVFESHETLRDDEIFPVRQIGTIVSNRIENNEIFNDPDYTMHVVSNMRSGVFAVDKRNIVVPIREYGDITSFGRENLSDHDKDFSKYQGVYIIERYVLHNADKCDIEALVKYYKENASLSQESCDNLYNDIRQQHHHNGKTAVIRFVTFVSKKDIDYYKYVQVKNVGLCIVKGMPMRNFIHPSSIITHIKKPRLEDDDSMETCIVIDIVDNKNHYKPYYMTIGNSVERIFSRPDSEESDGAVFVFKKNGSLIDDERKYNPDEYHSIGIYENEDAAIYKGDRKAQLENLRLEVAMNSHSLSKTKLDRDETIENMRIEQMKEKHLHDIRMKVLSANIDIALMREKMKMSNADFMDKIRLEENKQRREDEKNIVNIAVTLFKAFTAAL